MTVPPKLLAKLTKLSESDLREVQDHIGLILALHGSQHQPGRLEYSTIQWDFLGAVGKASVMLTGEGSHLGSMVARKCGRKECLSAFKACEIVRRKAFKQDLPRKHRIGFYETLAEWAADYREARSPVLDPRHAQQLVVTIEEVIAGIQPTDVLSRWKHILRQRTYRRQVSPQAIMRELQSPMTVIAWAFPGYAKAGALGLVFSSILARGARKHESD